MSPRAGDVMGYHVRGCAMLCVWIFKTAARFSSDCLYYSIESNSIAHAEPVSESPRPVRWRETVRSAVRRGDLPEPRYAANTQPCRLTIPAPWLPVWKLLPTSSKPSSSTGKAGKAGRSVPTTRCSRPDSAPLWACRGLNPAAPRPKTTITSSNDSCGTTTSAATPPQGASISTRKGASWWRPNSPASPDGGQTFLLRRIA